MREINMSDYDDEFDFEDDPRESNAIKEIRKALRATEKRAKEAEARASALEAKERERNLVSLLGERGLNQKIAKFIPSDVVDEQALSTWLDEYADVFGGSAPQDTDGASDQGQQPAGINIDDYKQLNAAVNAGVPPTGDEAQLMALIQGVNSMEDLNQILHGNPNGPYAQ